MDPPNRPPAKEVGDAFAEQYYFVLEHWPEEIFRVYKDHSQIGRRGEDGNMRNLTLLDIDKNNLNTISSGGFDSIEITSVDSQDSMDRRVMVQVCGYFILKERVKRDFTQVFFLAPQERGYFVLNEMLRFYDNGDEHNQSKNSLELTENSTICIDKVEERQQNLKRIRREKLREAGIDDMLDWQKLIEEGRVSKDFDFWGVQKSMEEQSKPKRKLENGQDKEDVKKKKIEDNQHLTKKIKT